LIDFYLDPINHHHPSTFDHQQKHLVYITLIRLLEVLVPITLLDVIMILQLILVLLINIHQISGFSIRTSNVICPCRSSTSPPNKISSLSSLTTNIPCSFQTTRKHYDNREQNYLNTNTNTALQKTANSNDDFFDDGGSSNEDITDIEIVNLEDGDELSDEVLLQLQEGQPSQLAILKEVSESEIYTFFGTCCFRCISFAFTFASIVCSV
jgi:hypothetical protein